MEYTTNEYSANQHSLHGSHNCCLTQLGGSFQKPNNVSIKDASPALHAHKCIDKIRGAKKLLMLDANAASCLIEIDECNYDKTSFMAHQGL